MAEHNYARDHALTYYDDAEREAGLIDRVTASRDAGQAKVQVVDYIISCVHVVP